MCDYLNCFDINKVIYINYIFIFYSVYIIVFLVIFVNFYLYISNFNK